ncbi:UNVERIFIED_CONTAM: hypothetical protein Slati_0515400 [Sesamum latifolium]|uniref:DNA helicase Pif1-like 2B domain-containing protein n=1 Tax=Sesamum latifolium TaxID=2727402 RepID=A0AAW2Y034_9LAMI
MRSYQDEEFSQFFLRLGDGVQQSYNGDFVQLPQSMIIPWEGEHSIHQLIDSIFLNMIDHVNDANYMMMINNLYNAEFLNSLRPSGLPPHRLILKRGSPVMLLRNVAPELGLCNGTRLICRNLCTNFIDAEIITGKEFGAIEKFIDDNAIWIEELKEKMTSWCETKEVQTMPNCTKEKRIAWIEEWDLRSISITVTKSGMRISMSTSMRATQLIEQVASLTAAVGDLLKHVQARDDQLNKLHEKFQSAPALNEFEEQDLSVVRNTSKEISVSTNGFVSVEHVKNTVNEAIAKTYETRVQVFKSYMKPYTKRIEQLRMPENYQPPKFQQFNGHGDPRQHIAYFVETCNKAGTDGDLLTKQLFYP